MNPLVAERGHEELCRATMDAERRQATFPSRELTYLLDGSPKITEMKERAMMQLMRDPVFWKSSFNMTLLEERERVFASISRLLEYFALDAQVASTNSLEYRLARWSTLQFFERAMATRLAVHFGLALRAIERNGSDEQVEEWAESIRSCKYLFGFAMTEMGHGSNVPMLETLATYQDDGTGDFILHSPTETSAKMWIGGAAHTISHAIVYARLIVKGVNKGAHAFIVPLRNMETWRTLPGVVIGDCGPKMGQHGVDNGWILFSHVRIPKKSLLSRYAHLSDAGVYSAPPNAQLAYASLIDGRCSVLLSSGEILRVALTIALRYSVIRRQFAPSHISGDSHSFSHSDKDEEVQLISYPMHQRRVLPPCGAALCFAVVARNMRWKLDSLEGGSVAERIKVLKDFHPLSAGLKAWSSWYSARALEGLRQTLGGFGYSSALSGISTLVTDFAVNCTWEGDNSVMSLQCGHYLLSCYHKVMKDETMHGSVTYLNELEAMLEAKLRGMHWRETSSLLLAAQHVASYLLHRLAGRIASQKDVAAAFIQHGAEVVRVSLAHSFCYLVSSFAELLETVKQTSPAIDGVITLLFQVFCVEGLLEYTPEMLQSGFMEAKDLDSLRDALGDVCAELRPDTVALPDAMNIPDQFHQSPLGARDGNVYRHVMDVLKQMPDGQVGSSERLPYFEHGIRPLLSRL